jgi:hypothetical protein
MFSRRTGSISLSVVKYNFSYIFYFSRTGAGKPINLRNGNNRACHVSPQSVPINEEAVTNYEQMGGNITQFPVFGRDPSLMKPWWLM